jgi:hypothetical protein
MAWMNAHGDLILDCWLFIKVAISYCALALYYHCVATRDAESLRSLEAAKDIMRRWSLSPVTNRPRPSRSKIADLVEVLHLSAAKAMQPTFAPSDVVADPGISMGAHRGPAPVPEYAFSGEAGIGSDSTEMPDVEMFLDDVLGGLFEFP